MARWAWIRVLLTIALSAVLTATLGAPAGTSVLAKSSNPCGKSRTPTPKDALVTPYLQGNMSPTLPAGDPRKIAVLAVGPQAVNFGSPSNSVALVIRNNTCSPVTHVEVTATVRSSTGALVASANSQGIEPPTLGPGEVGIGHLYLGSQALLPTGVQYTFTTAGQKSFGVLKDYLAGLKMTGSNETTQQSGDLTIPNVIGTVLNPRKATVTGPFGVDVVCLDQTGKPLGEAGGFANAAGDSLPAGGSASFTVPIYATSTCPIFLAGGSGFDNRGLRAR
jgi:hypothetical protein